MRIASFREANISAVATFLKDRHIGQVAFVEAVPKLVEAKRNAFQILGRKIEDDGAHLESAFSGHPAKSESEIQ